MATTGNEFGQGATMGNDGGMNQGGMNDDGVMSEQRQSFGRTGERGAGGAQDAIERVAANAQDTVERVADSASDYAERLGTRGAQLMDDARDYIASNPMRSIGIAAAAGFLVARMMR